MSVCDTIGYIKEGLTVYARKSEFEQTIVFPAECKGIWYDIFDTKYHNNSEVLNYILHDKDVCLVSPELHGQPYIDTWKKYKDLPDEHLSLCTDRPLEAGRFFNRVKS
jgi:hypothetical protein